MAEPSERYPLSTTRVGLIFAFIAMVVAGCAVQAHAIETGANLRGILWIVSLAACSLGGVAAMTSLRTLRTIESEIRCLGGDADASKESGHPSRMRAVISADPVTHHWNEMLSRLEGDFSHEDSERQTATLDEEVVTLARAMRGLPIAWAVTDNDGFIRQIGAGACAMLTTTTPDEVVGRHVRDLFEPTDASAPIGMSDGDLSPEQDQAAKAEVDQAFGKLLSQVRLVHQVLKLTLAGRTAELRVTRSRMAGRSGDSEGLVWVFTDVTQQRAATESRDQFLMTATHELRTPLNNLQAYAEALAAEEDLEVEKQKEFCNTIHSEANRLGRLIDQLLTVSQMEAGSLIANCHELDLLPVLEYAIDQLAANADRKNIQLTAELPNKLSTVIGDRDKLQAAVVNLVGNAVKYTPEGGEVTLRCTSDETDILVSVTDNGPGISEAEQAKVFEKFYRCAQAVDSEHQGNGIGLAFSREIARLHGGGIELKSVVGEGSVFTLSIPVGGRSRSGL